jgi:hypothetical protein
MPNGLAIQRFAQRLLDDSEKPIDFAPNFSEKPCVATTAAMPGAPERRLQQ